MIRPAIGLWIATWRPSHPARHGRSGRQVRTMKPETAPMHATIAATADLHLIRTRPDEPSPLLCHGCRLRGGTSYYLTERRLQAHLAAHRNAGHDIPEGIEP